MRLLFLIFLLAFECPGFGQDSLQKQDTLVIDTMVAKSATTTADSTPNDSVSPVSTRPVIKKISQQKKGRHLKAKELPIVTNEKNAVNDDAAGNINGLVVLGVILIAIFIVLGIYRFTHTANPAPSSSNSKDQGLMSDNLSRLLLSRRDYYQNVYLKSDAWKRKRHVVLKRDNWRCVYCNGKATEVHHLRYAKRNIGKEPIEWLVSICRTCHDARHYQ